MIDNKVTVKDDEKVNIQGGAIGHRSIWIGLTYKYAIEEREAEEVEAIICETISETGRVQGNEIRERCEKPRSCEGFFNTIFTPTLQRSLEVEVKGKNDDVPNVEFHHCPLLKTWQGLGFGDALCAELCDVAMDGDGSIAKAMGFDFHSGGAIAGGHPTCRVGFSRKK